MAVLKWKFVDPSDPDPLTNNYTFEWSPNTQTSPFAKRNITFLGTTATNGQPLMWEGQREPMEMTFGGAIPNRAQYEALRKWVYDRNGRMFIYDHFGRRMTVLFTGFDPTPPERARGSRYWYHTFQITCRVLAITAPTVGNGGPA